MADSPALRWRQRGSVYLWRYTENERNYPGWNLTADAAGSVSLAELLELMSHASFAVSRSVKITPPSVAVLAVPSNRNGAAAWKVARALELRYRGETRARPDDWALEANGGVVTLAVGGQRLAQLRRAVDDIRAGVECDYSVGPEDASDASLLFVWTYPT